MYFPSVAVDQPRRPIVDPAADQVAHRAVRAFQHGPVGIEEPRADDGAVRVCALADVACGVVQVVEPPFTVAQGKFVIVLLAN
jgi:hypothetical protein